MNKYVLYTVASIIFACFASFAVYGFIDEIKSLKRYFERKRKDEEEYQQFIAELEEEYQNGGYENV